MRIFSKTTPEEGAAGFTGAVARLRFLRQAERRRAGRREFVSQFSKIGFAAAILLSGNSLGRSRPPAPVAVPAVGKTEKPARIWVVEQNASRVLYSNGLAVNRAFEAESVPRRYRVYRRGGLEPIAGIRTEPAGIVYHTTESEIIPLEPERNTALLRHREEVLAHVRNARCYNFVIDRFGQVYRIVPETQTARHAGHSVWAAGETVWVDLNESFLGVSFEAESNGNFEPAAAQVHAGALLTQVLRSRFDIPEENCATHAQVSVNPDNMRMGYHTDWGSSFPFQAMGLQDGYALPVASIAVFGFGHDEAFRRATGNRLWPGIERADEEIARRAQVEGLTAGEVRGRLQQQYKNLRRHGNG